MFNDQSAENKVIVFGTVRKCIDLLASFRNISNRIAYIVNTGEDASDPFFSNYIIYCFPVPCKIQAKITGMVLPFLYGFVLR